jgi:hypothetical protein
LTAAQGTFVESYLMRSGEAMPFGDDLPLKIGGANNALNSKTNTTFTA